MAKDNRFPSQANNKKKAQDEAKAAAKAGKPEAKDEAKEVVSEGKASNLVQIHYSGDNHHFLNHVQHLSKGMNQVSQDVYESAKEHPTFKKLQSDGTIVVKGLKEEEAVEKADEEVQESGDESDKSDAEKSE